MKEGDGKSVTGRLTDRTYYLVADTKEACDLWVMMLHEMYPPPFHRRMWIYHECTPSGASLLCRAHYHGLGATKRRLFTRARGQLIPTQVAPL